MQTTNSPEIIDSWNIFSLLFRKKIEQQQEPSEVRLQKYQVIQRKEWFFAEKTDIIFKPERFKSEAQIVEEQNASIKRTNPFGSSLYKSIKVTNIHVEWKNNTVNIRF